MSVSPRKRLNAFPEVVIYTKPKSPSKISAANAAREKAAKEEAEFNGLTRIEQIRLRARRKAEEEDRERQQAESRLKRRQRTVEPGSSDDVDDEEEDVDELPDLDLKRVTRQSTIKSSPGEIKSYGSEFEGPLSSLTTTTTDEISSSLSLPHSQNGPSTLQRSRRTTARVEPYIFRPSLDPVSERRQKLRDAKESAAVQANVIKREDFKKSPYEGKSDAMEKVLRDHRREQKRGIDMGGLYKTVEMAKDINEMISKQKQQEDKAVGRSESGDTSDDDTSVASSSRSDSPLSTPKDDRTLLFQQSLTDEQKELQKRSLLEENAEEEDSKEGSSMFDILMKDKELANRKRQVGQGVDIGNSERQFWKQERVPMERVIFPSIVSDDTVYKMLRDASSKSAGSGRYRSRY